MLQKAHNLFGELEGVGPNIAMHLWEIGMRSRADIAAVDPEKMYIKDKLLNGDNLDRCLLYVYRCVQAVCAAELNNQTLEPALHKWWNWSDKNLQKATGTGTTTNG